MKIAKPMMVGCRSRDDSFPRRSPSRQSSVTADDARTKAKEYARENVPKPRIKPPMPKPQKVDQVRNYMLARCNNNKVENKRKLSVENKDLLGCINRYKVTSCVMKLPIK